MEINYDVSVLKYQSLLTAFILVLTLTDMALIFFDFDLFANIFYLYSYKDPFTHLVGIVALWSLILTLINICFHFLFIRKNSQDIAKDPIKKKTTLPVRPQDVSMTALNEIESNVSLSPAPDDTSSHINMIRLSHLTIERAD